MAQTDLGVGEYYLTPRKIEKITSPPTAEREGEMVVIFCHDIDPPHNKWQMTLTKEEAEALCRDILKVLAQW